MIEYPIPPFVEEGGVLMPIPSGLFHPVPSFIVRNNPILLLKQIEINLSEVN